jgi:hypothetical protein
MRKFILLISGIAGVLICTGAYAQGMAERFKGREQFAYKIYFNGIYSGTINWQYKGKQEIDGRKVEVLQVISDTKILKFLNMDSQENIYLDAVNYLPVKVERNLIMFGSKEVIRETYDQQQGLVKIEKSAAKNEVIELKQTPPIHNILALLYFFPQDVQLLAGQSQEFNLPTQKVIIKSAGIKELKTKQRKKETYFLMGKGAKRFNLWLDKQDRLPLRLEFIMPVGKIVIISDDAPQGSPIKQEQQDKLINASEKIETK